MDIHLQKFLVGADKVLDYVPLVSSVTNLVDLFEKAVVVPPENTSSSLNNRYIRHIKDKSIGRCVILLVPVLGNITVALWDIGSWLFKSKKNDNSKQISPEAVPLQSSPEVSIESKIRKQLIQVEQCLILMYKANPEELKNLDTNDPNYRKIISAVLVVDLDSKKPVVSNTKTLQYASNEIQKELIGKDVKLLKHASVELQLELAKVNPQLIPHMSAEAKRMKLL